MTVRTTQDTVGSLYSNDAELAFVEGEVARIMFTAGLDWADIDTTTIDDIVNKIRETYEEGLSLVLGAEGHRQASDDWNYLKQQHLIDVVRRVWRRRAMAIGRA
jgi:hypothetical protein|tara:strand:- start:3192 stop:3503 length:312 start_codon:yes stop_codon:yes gene_type:complete